MEKTVDIKKLFTEKKYKDLIEIVDGKVPDNQKNSSLLNVLGACRLLVGKNNKESLSLAIKDFRRAYLMENNTNNSRQAFINFINTSISLNNYENSFRYFNEAVDYFEKNKDELQKHHNIVLAIIRVYKKLVDTKKIKYYFFYLIQNNFINSFVITNYIYINCLFNEWSQENFFEYGKMLNNSLPKYQEDKLIPIKILKKQKIRIGFISADIKKKHSVTYFLKSIFENYNQNEYEIYLYLNFNQSEEDETTNFFKKFATTKYISDLDDIQTIRLIREDSLDIVIDLMGITSKSRLSLIKNRLANIQILWCGYCNTTGVENMDYIIADPNLIFENEKNLYSEKIIFLPDIWNSHGGINMTRKFNVCPIEFNQSVTFGSFNSFRKLNDNVIKTWSAILKKIPNSKLILKSSSNLIDQKILKKFEEENVINSIHLESYKKNFEDHINLYKKIDIALDTFPYNGVTTSFEALWMNVPVITMKGYNFNSRCGESINKNAGIENLIAFNEENYIQKACQLSQNVEELIKIRKNIFKNIMNTSLFNSKKFSYNFFNSLKYLIK